MRTVFHFGRATIVLLAFFGGKELGKTVAALLKTARSVASNCAKQHSINFLFL